MLTWWRPQPSRFMVENHTSADMDDKDPAGIRLKCMHCQRMIGLHGNRICNWYLQMWIRGSQACSPDEALVCKARQAPRRLSLPLAQVVVLPQVRLLASEDLMYRVACLCANLGSRAQHVLSDLCAFRPELFSMVVNAALFERLEERRYQQVKCVCV